MSRSINNSCLALLLLLLAGIASAQEIETIDRIIATVNRTPVLQSEWEDSLRYEAFLQGRPPQSFTEAERQASLGRLIDRVLIEQQMQADYSPTKEEVAAKLQDIRQQLKGADSDQGWQEMLRQYGLTETALSRATENQLKIMRFVELRLRPTVRVDRNDIADYYNEKLVPDLKKAGVEPQPLEKVSARIRELLVQQRIELVLEDWLVNLRAQSEVHYTQQSGEPAPPSQATSQTMKKDTQQP
jgi:hypothetical protein